MKIDLHRHFSGCLTASTIHNTLQQQGIWTNISIDEIQATITGVNKEHTFRNFLDRFKIFEIIKWTKDIIKMTSAQVIWNLASERINYCEIKISVDRYVEHLQLPPEEVIQIFHTALSEEAEKWDLEFGIVLGLKYETNKEKQLRFSKIIEDPNTAKLVVGIDLVGDEEKFDVNFYEPIFKQWKKAGKGLEAHVGESQPAENVAKAINTLHVDRIAHGIKIINHPEIIELVKKSNVCLDIALTSNIHTGVVDKYGNHPVKELLNKDIPITIGTDDPTILDTDLDTEYELLQAIFNPPEDKLMDIMYNSVKYAFKDLRRTS
jgi:adenosine deaminase